jgi:dolichol kinase
MNFLIGFVGYQAVAMIIVGSLLATLVGFAWCALKRTRKVGRRIAVTAGLICMCVIGLAVLEGSPELHRHF